MGGMPSVSASSSAASSLGSNGAMWGFDSSGWNVNMAGSGTSLQSASGGINWLYVALAVGAWYLLRK